MSPNLESCYVLQTLRGEHVRQMVRDVDHWNRLHLNEKPLSVDDETGSLATWCRSVGLDLATLEAEARR